VQLLPLESGYSKDVTGQMVVTPRDGLLPAEGRLLHYKTLDTSVKVFSRGSG
jgi:hypothetical protein